MIAVLLLAAIIVAGQFPSRHEPKSPFLARQRWPYRDVIIVLCLVTVIGLVPPSVLKTMEKRAWAVEGVFTLVIMASTWGLVRSKHRRPWSALGLNRHTAWYDTLWSLRIGLGTVAMLAVCVLLVRSLDPRNLSTPSGPAVWHGQIADFIAAVIVTTVFVPLAEELFFRGLAYGPLFRKFGAAGATLGTAVLWSAAHYSGLSFESLFNVSMILVLGIFYAEVYRRRESLVPTVVFHILHNTTAVFISDRYLVTLIPFAGVSVGLWIMSAVLFHAYRTRVLGCRRTADQSRP